MRCDYPMGYDEDYLEPACEIFLQLFLQNAAIAANEELNQDNEAAANVDLGGYESDDNFSFPSLHTVSWSEETLSSAESSGDEAEAEAILYLCDEDSNNPDNFTEMSFNDLSENDEESCNPENVPSEVSGLVSEITDVVLENQSTLTVNLKCEDSNDAVNCDDISNDSLQEADGSGTNRSNEGPQFQESSMQTDTLPTNSTDSSTNTYVSLYVVLPPTSFPNESDNLLSEVSSERQVSNTNPTPSLSPASDNENKPYDIFDEMLDNLEDMSNLGSPAVHSSYCQTENENEHHSLSEMDPALNNENSPSSSSVGSDNQNNVTEKKAYSLFTEIFDNLEDISNLSIPAVCSSSSQTEKEQDSLSVLDPASDNKNSPSSSSVVSDNGNNASERRPYRLFTEIIDSLEEESNLSNIGSPAISRTFSETENDKKLSKLDPALDMENSASSDTKSENTIVFDENLHHDFETFDADLSENLNIHPEGDTSCDVTTDKLVSNLKRKVVSSVEVNRINKVPKYSVAHESNKSVNEVSSDTEMAIICDEDNTDVVPCTINLENVMLSLGKTVEENSVSELKTDL